MNSITVLPIIFSLHPARQDEFLLTVDPLGSKLANERFIRFYLPPWPGENRDQRGGLGRRGSPLQSIRAFLWSLFRFYFPKFPMPGFQYRGNPCGVWAGRFQPPGGIFGPSSLTGETDSPQIHSSPNSTRHWSISRRKVS